MSLSYIKQRLKGGLETALLMRQGLTLFDGTPRETLLSFSIIFITLPVKYISTLIHPPLGMDGIDPGKIYGVHFFASCVSMLVGFLVIYGFARYVTKNQEKVWLYYSVGNWVAFVFLPLSFLLLFVKHAGMIGDKTMEDLMLVLTLYGFVIGACIIYNIFRPPWELAGALACFFLVKGQVILDASYTLFDLPIVDYMDVYGAGAKEALNSVSSGAADIDVNTVHSPED